MSTIHRHWAAPLGKVCLCHELHDGAYKEICDNNSNLEFVLNAGSLVSVHLQKHRRANRASKRAVLLLYFNYVKLLYFDIDTELVSL